MVFDDYELIEERYQNDDQSYELIKNTINTVLFNGFDRSGIDYRLRLISDTKFILNMRIPVYESKMGMLPRLKERLRVLGINCDYRRNSGPSSTHHYIHFTVHNTPSLDRGDTYSQIVNVLNRVLYSGQRNGENVDFKIIFVRYDRFSVRFDRDLYWNRMSGDRSLPKIRNELAKVFGACTYSISSNRYPYIYVYYNIPANDDFEEQNYEDWFDESLITNFDDFLNENNHIEFIEKIEEFENQLDDEFKILYDEKDNFLESNGYRFGQYVGKLADISSIIINFADFFALEKDVDIYESAKPIILKYFNRVKKELQYLDNMIKSERLDKIEKNIDLINNFYKIYDLIKEIQI